MKKVDIIARAEQLEDLKEALNRIGVQGMTVSQVLAVVCKRTYRSLSRQRIYSKFSAYG